MVQPVTVGLDIAKNVFHAYGVDAHGERVLSRKLRRAQVEAFFAKIAPCLVGIEACATAHYWARTIRKLGHQVRLMPPAYVKPYVKTQKNDAADAEAICEAVTRPNMRFAETKTIEQQSVLVLHRTRATLITHRTRMGNTIRAHLAEFGITESIGRIGLSRLIDIIVSGEDERITDVTRRALMCLVDQYCLLQGQILELDRQVMAWHKSNETSKRLATIPGIMPMSRLCRAGCRTCIQACATSAACRHNLLSKPSVFAPRKMAGHMGASDQLCATSQKVLANGVPSTHGTSQPSQCRESRRRR